MAKKRKKDDEKGVDIGLVTTCSLFLILLTFFILLNSIAKIDERKGRKAIGSLKGSFGSLKGGLSPLKTGQLIMPPSTPLVEQKLNFQKLLSDMDVNILTQIKVVTDKDRAIITINEKVLFDKNKHSLKSASNSLLDKLGRFINKGDYPVEIVGHTDNRSADEKGYNSNWEITSLMAIQVLKYFVEKGKVAEKRLTAYGYGSHKPIASNDTIQSRRQNRRIEIVLRYRVPKYVKRIFREKPAGIFTYKRFNFKVF